MSKLYARFAGATIVEVKTQRAKYFEDIRRRQEIPPHLYSILPWSLEDLPGTVWRNVHTADLVIVRGLGEDRWGRLGSDPTEFGGMFSIGLWRDVGFCIEHWIRVDVLPADEQIAWAKERIIICRRDLLRVKDKLLEAKRGEGSITYVKCEVEWESQKLEQARQELASLYKKLGVGLRENILNVGILPGEQMRMF